MTQDHNHKQRYFDIARYILRDYGNTAAEQCSWSPSHSAPSTTNVAAGMPMHGLGVALHSLGFYQDKDPDSHPGCVDRKSCEPLTTTTLF